MARSPLTRWYSALAALVIFVLLAWLLGAVLTLSDGERVALRVGLIVLGLVAAVALLWYLRPQDEPAPTPDSRGDDLAATIASARARLPRGVFDSKTLVLVMGSEGSCKSTVVARSGTDPELLAGDARASGGDVPVPTATANFWLVKDAVLAEAGGPVFADAARWKRMVRALRAPRLSAALGRGAAAPRAAVVCVSCDVFLGPNASTQLDGLGQLIRLRLTEAARELGVALPVYVLFTKADRLPHFETWVAPLTRDEVRAPVGAALPFDETSSGSGAARARAAGTYAERIVPRLEAAFAKIVSALAGRRVDFLGRESLPEKRLAAYELPRELGKLAPAATRFLEEICRPVHVGVSPQLRGFYFVGARPIVVAEAAEARAASPKPAAQRQGTSNATNVFTPIQQGGGDVAPVAVTPGRQSLRRVPQWVFLDRLFTDVILADSGAAAMARGGTRVAGLRRGLLAVGIAASLIATFGVVRSWLGNRTLAERTSSAARDVATLPVVAAPAGSFAFPSADALRRLDLLRGVLDTLHGYTTTGVPNRLAWGLWRGHELLASGRRVWLEGYRRQLHASAFAALVDSLRALPDNPRPTDDYGQDYAMLKAYLIMTAESPRSTPEFLAPVLLTSWSRGQTLDADVVALARRQFEFYGTGLALDNPWPLAADAQIVNHTRTFLNRFSGEEQIYQYMIAQADKATPPARLADVAPQAPGVVAAPAEVPGSFTTAGWAFMQNAFRDSDRFFEGERWVVGDATATQAQERDRILASLRMRYRNDYVQRWRAFVRNTSVVRPTPGREGVKNAAQKLGILGGPQSPLLATLSFVARNTAVDSVVSASFQPVHVVTPPEATDKYVNDGNQSYANALVSLQGALEQVTYMPAAVDTASALAMAQAGQTALGQVTQAKSAARQLAQKFAIDTGAVKIGPAVAELLVAPINGAEGVLRVVAATGPPSPRRAAPAPVAPAPPPPGGGGGGGGNKAAEELAAILNARGQAICDDMRPMLAKFPFNPDASAEATVAEVNGLLAPGSGQLAAFQKERLEGLLEKQGAEWAAKAGAPVALSAPFVAFFNSAARVSDALFRGGTVPRVVFHARGITTPQTPLVTVTHGSQVAPFRQNTPPGLFVWPAPSGREARLLAVFGKEREREVVKATGEWAIFRLVAQAAKVEGEGGSLRAEWNATGKGAVPVAVEFTIESGAPVLRRGWLGGMACAAQVTR